MCESVCSACVCASVCVFVCCVCVCVCVCVVLCCVCVFCVCVCIHTYTYIYTGDKLVPTKNISEPHPHADFLIVAFLLQEVSMSGGVVPVGRLAKLRPSDCHASVLRPHLRQKGAAEGATIRRRSRRRWPRQHR